MSSTVQYTDMKDSGIKWVGSVPSHWHLHTHQLATQVKNKNSDLRKRTFCRSATENQAERHQY